MNKKETQVDDPPPLVPDWQVAHSARYILEDLNNDDGMKKMAELTGLPLGVISAAFKNFFPAGHEREPEWGDS